MMTRRDILAAFLGVPMAAACHAKKRIPDGELAFQPEVLGHRLRDARPPEIPADRWERAGIVIVGAGIAGLSAARHLRAKGYDDFVMLELDSAPGGTARCGQNGTSAYPWGAHYITAPMKENVELLAFLRELDLVEGTSESGEPIFREEVQCREPQERLYQDGEWHDGIYPQAGETDDEKMQFARFRKRLEGFAGMRDGKGRRAFAVPTHLGSDDAQFTALDRTTIADWLGREGFTSARIRWLVDYACRDDFGTRAEETSAWAGIHYWASRVLEPGREAQPVLTWPAGNGWLVSKLAEKARGKIRLGLAAADVVPTDEGVDVIALGAPPVAVGIHAKRVVFAAPQYVSRVAIRPYREAPPAHLQAFDYGAWMVANLTLSARPSGRGRAGRVLAWDNVIKDSPSLGYVCATHQTGRDDGPTVLTYYYPLCDSQTKAARTRLYAASRDEWADVALMDLEVAHPDLRSLVTRLDVARWGHAMVRPTPGFLFGGARAAAREPYRGIHFAHTDLSGVSLFEEAFHHGIRAADEALAALRSSP